MSELLCIIGILDMIGNVIIFCRVPFDILLHIGPSKTYQNCYRR